MNDTSTLSSVRWRRIALFYGIALGWAVLIGLAFYLLGQRDLAAASAPWVFPVMAVGYMPVPLVAALITEKIAGEGYLMRRIFTRRLGPQLVRTLIAVPLIIAALILTMAGLTWIVGNVAGIAGVGRLLFSVEDLVANVIAVTGTSMDAAAVAQVTAATPPLWGLLAITLVGALVAGFTINGLFAFGEEYGWRGWLADELAPLGPVWANLITGVMWGLWHAPVILLGYNYGSYRLPGVVAMIAWCVAGSFLLWRVRQVTGTVLAAAITHGAINGFAGIFLVVLADPNRLLAAPMGAVGIAAVGVVAVLLWIFGRPVAAAAEVSTEAEQDATAAQNS
ncbi:MAG: CPBP family intramembrane metalloprotease [Propionibacteriales bacterium]|nr:CPBP family intramembrane metalloprotease [Propionibacteriales bacterium]